ncbi:MAG: hypothetical protein IKU13_00655 [Clostridia bacterium]|nr:hypothetical protein [Clostridia bacterium]MBR5265648.1 hypothetical protein [Clostridia bacterium]
MTTYEKYKLAGINLAHVGFEERGEHIPYFCTPQGAKILGCPGVDGIHFCFVDGFGENVFAISPMNCPGEYVHIVAECFGDFLALLVSCRDTAAIEQAWQWSKSSFEMFIAEYPPTDEAKSAFAQLEQKLGITPMAEPYDYMMALQKSFDYSKLKFTEEYYDLTGEPQPEE